MNRTGRQFQNESKPEAKNPFSRKPGNETVETAVSPFAQVLHLQGTVGNKEVARLVRSRTLQTKFKPGRFGHNAVPSIEPGIRSLNGRGRPLSETDRNFFDTRFGTDFSRVRVHTGSTANAFARSVNARAFAAGNHVVFGAGQYAPGTPAGKRLLAHELTHVVQQKKSPKPMLQRFKAKWIEGDDGGRIYLIPEEGDTDRDLDRVLCRKRKDRKIAGRDKIDVTNCFPKGTMDVAGGYNCAHFVNRALGRASRGDELDLTMTSTGKLWNDRIKKGAQVSSFALIDKEGRVKTIKRFSWRPRQPRTGDLVFMSGDISGLPKGQEPNPEADNFGVRFDHVGFFIVRSREGFDYHLAKDGDDHGIGVYRTGSTDPADAAGAYDKGDRSGVAYLTGDTIHTVKRGENLSKIAVKYYGDRHQWRRIYDANRDTIRNPAVIRRGMRLLIPNIKKGE